MKKIEEIIRNRYLIFDGAMGTSLQKMDMAGLDFRNKKKMNELLNIYYPEYVSAVHRGFIEAGADIIETNTFSASATVLSRYGFSELTCQINREAVRIAIESANSYDRDIYVAGSVGPTDKLPSLGQISFDDMVEGYQPQMEGLISGRADIVILETFQDPLGIKAALKALERSAKKHNHFPYIMVSVTFSENGNMLLGTTPEAVLYILEPYDLFSVGINCSLGPSGLRKPLEVFARHYNGYISFMPNAGLPKKENQILHYDLKADDFAQIMSQYASELGIDIIGGCCGTDSEYIRKLKEASESLEKKSREIEPYSGVASLYKGFEYKQTPAPFIIGERTNMAGSRKFSALAREGDIEKTAMFCRDYSLSGMHGIDLFLKKGGNIDDEYTVDLVRRLSLLLNVALCFDSKDIGLIEKILKHYPGRMIINSASLKDGEKKLLEYLRITRIYGASIVLLAIDEKGMAVGQGEKIKIFRRILECAKESGLKDSQIILDPLTFSIVSGDRQYADSASESLKTLREIKRLFPSISTVMGVSNISYGVKGDLRRLINSVFLYEAVRNGLDMAIINAGDILPMNRIDKDMADSIKDLILNRNNEGSEILKRLLSLTYHSADITEKAYASPADRIKADIINGNQLYIKDQISDLLRSGEKPDFIIEKILLEAISEVGRLFKEGYIPLPFVLQSARVMKDAFSAIAEKMPINNSKKEKKLILATVKGDIHDIGKNLVDIIVSSHGYNVVNLGVEVDIKDIIDTVRNNDNCYLGLSGLINESLDVMEDYAAKLVKADVDIPVIFGGAAVSEGFVRNVLRKIYKRALYGKDAFDAVSMLEGKKGRDAIAGIQSNKQDKVKKRGEKAIERKNTDLVFRDKDTVHSFQLGLSDIVPGMDIKRLFRVRWTYKIKEGSGKMPDLKELKSRMDTMLDKLYESKAVAPAANYCYASVIREKNRLHILKNGKFMDFQRDGFSFIDYFHEKKEDTIIFFAATAGEKAWTVKNSLLDRGNYAGYHLMNGLINEILETFLNLLSKHIENECGLYRIEGIKPLRLAYGYPYCPRLREQEKVYGLLDLERMGLRFTELYQIIPEESSSGFILPFVAHNKSKTGGLK